MRTINLTLSVELAPLVTMAENNFVFWSKWAYICHKFSGGAYVILCRCIENQYVSVLIITRTSRI